MIVSGVDVKLDIYPYSRLIAFTSDLLIGFRKPNSLAQISLDRLTTWLRYAVLCISEQQSTVYGLHAQSLAVKLTVQSSHQCGHWSTLVGPTPR